MSDQYKTIQDSTTGEYKDRGSKFIAYAFPVSDNSAWQDNLEKVKKEHFKARHHCFAFRLGLDGNNFRASDDGEPSGTAGRPILGQIDSFELTNILIVVVRYFGGTKLGTSGLINAYRSAAADAIQNALIIEKTVEDIFRINFDYGLMSQVMNAVKKLDLEIVQQEFGQTAWLDVAIPKSKVTEQLKNLQAKIANIRIEELESVKNIPGLQINYQRTR